MMSPKKQLLFIVNPISGTQDKQLILNQIKEKIDGDLFDVTICKTQYAGHAYDIATEAVKNGVDFVVAIGGDGTINEVGRALIHTKTALGIIPCGSGNGLARHLHIPMDAEKAIDVINELNVKAIDYGVIAGHPFFCTCGVGFDAFVSLKFADSGKRGLLSYLENTLKQSLTYKPETYEIENSTGSVKYKAFLIACANASQYGNNAYIAPQASLTDGKMDIVVLEPFTVLDAGPLAFQLFNRTLDKNSRIKTMLDKKIVIHRASEGVFHFDGDPTIGGKDLEVEIKPLGLNVITPKHPEDNRDLFNFAHIVNEFIQKQPLTTALSEKQKQLAKLNKNVIQKISKIHKVNKITRLNRSSKSTNNPDKKPM